MSIEMSRLMAHIVIVSITLMAIGFVGATLISLTRIAFCNVKKVQKPNDFTFTVGSVVSTQPVRRLPSRRVFKKTKKPMAISQQSQMLPSWSPSLSPSEEKSLTIPTFLRNKKPATSCATESQPATQKVATLAQDIVEDLFAKKDIFQLDPAPGS